MVFMNTMTRKNLAAQMAAIPGHDRMMYQVSLRVLVARLALVSKR